MALTYAAAAEVAEEYQRGTAPGGRALTAAVSAINGEVQAKQLKGNRNG